MSIVSTIQQATIASLGELFNQPFSERDFQLSQTKPEFEGDYTIVLFSLVKSLRQSPDALGNQLGAQLLADHPGIFSKFNIIKGFLNLTISDGYWLSILQEHAYSTNYGRQQPKGRKVMVEYASPNTNKPLHLGHLRNIFLGWSVAEIYKANGFEVVKSCIVNDRGIHICKSMLAWQKYAAGATPASTGIKGDHLVGDYYVRFEADLKAEAGLLLERIAEGDLTGISETDRPKLEKISGLLPTLTGEKDAEKRAKLLDDQREIARNNTPIMAQAKQMLLDWEQGKPEVIELWRTMNSWVYEGFDATYQRLGNDFDKIYYESDTYLLGKDIVQQGLAQGVFYKKEDGSTWIDLTAEGLDEKIVQRRDGTSVYITQDIGLARQKYEQYHIDESIYVIGNEQNYHMKVLQQICKKLGMPNADNIVHLSYGMVELTTGKMKSREGTVVDADDIIDEMVQTAADHTRELGKVQDFSEPELAKLYNTLGLGAMKFYLLRVDPKKTMVFNPAESIDFHGFTGPFIQYTHARIRSILRKTGEQDPATAGLAADDELLPLEKEVVILLEKYPGVLAQSCTEHDPSVVAAYLFSVAQTFNSFYTQHSIAKAETALKKILRLQISVMTAQVLRSGMALLGIEVPEQM